jgi:hypothetical protein
MSDAGAAPNLGTKPPPIPGARGAFWLKQVTQEIVVYMIPEDPIAARPKRC